MKLSLLIAIITISIYSSAQTGPGGVGNNIGTSSLQIWYSSDFGITLNGTGGVTAWDNGAGVVAHDLQTGGVNSTPRLVSNAVNGYDEVSFDTNDFLQISGALTTGNFITNQASTYLVTRRPSATSSNVYTTYPLRTNRFSCHVSWSNSNVYYDIGNCCNNSARIQINRPGGLTNYSYWSYDAHASTGKQLYRNGNLLQNRANTRTYSSHASQSFRIGVNFNGDIAEMLIFNQKVNRAQRYIIENYLSAKYAITAASNDIYTQDDPLKGNYDHDVAGIGRVDASNQHSNSQGTGIVHILNPTDLGNNEFLMWGHDNGGLTFTNTTDMPSNVLSSRLTREWRVSEVNTSGTAVDVGDIDMRFDLTGLGTLVASDLRLLVDTDNDGIFVDESPISGATSLGGNVYQFAGVSDIANNLRFTLALSCATTSSITQTVCDSLRSPSSKYLWTNTGTYMDTIPNTAGCDSIMTFNLTVNYTSTITLSRDIVDVCQNDDSAVFPFTGSTNNPNLYSLNFNSVAENEGFVDVVDAVLLGSSITISIPTVVLATTYNASLTVKNATENCPSPGQDIQIVVHPLPSPRLYID